MERVCNVYTICIFIRRIRIEYYFLSRQLTDAWVVGVESALLGQRTAAATYCIISLLLVLQYEHLLHICIMDYETNFSHNKAQSLIRCVCNAVNPGLLKL